MRALLVLLYAAVKLAGSERADKNSNAPCIPDELLGSVAGWVNASFGTLPCYEDPALTLNGGLSRLDQREVAPALLSWAQFRALGDMFLNTSRSELSISYRWPFERDATVTRRLRRLFNARELMPHVQKLVLPVGSTVAVFGDLHGSLHSILRELISLVDRGLLGPDGRVPALLEKPFFLLFLGDFVDRGKYGVEVLALLLWLRARNPHAVFFARGNHEDLSMNDEKQDGTFRNELQRKFSSAPKAELDAYITQLYNVIPLAIFIGTGETNMSSPTSPLSYLLCVHGGIEVGFDPRPLLRTPIDEAHSGISSGAGIQYALVRGLRRRDWLQSPSNTAMRDGLSPKLRSLFTNYGRRNGGESDACSRSHTCGSTSTCIDIAADDDSCRDAEDEEGNGTDAAANDDAAAYPVDITNTKPFHGWQWNDFYVSNDTALLDYRPGRGLAFGKPLTSHWLSSSGGIVGVLRAHQHNDHPSAGPMMSSVRAARGAFDNWNGSGLVITMLSGAHIPGQRFIFDAYALLHFHAGDPSTWRMHLCSQPTGAPFTRVKEGGVYAWVGGRVPPQYAIGVPLSSAQVQPHPQQSPLTQHQERQQVQQSAPLVSVDVSPGGQQRDKDNTDILLDSSTAQTVADALIDLPSQQQQQQLSIMRPETPPADSIVRPETPHTGPLQYPDAPSRLCDGDFSGLLQCVELPWRARAL